VFDVDEIGLGLSNLVEDEAVKGGLVLPFQSITPDLEEEGRTYKHSSCSFCSFASARESVWRRFPDSCESDLLSKCS
jgi:hypothetical protein